MKKIVHLLFISFAIIPLAYSQSEFEFKHYNQTTTPQLGGNNFKTVGVGKNGHIWAGSQYHGLVKFNPADSSWQASTSLTNVFISDIKTDQNGNIWVTNAGTAGGGTASNIAGGISLFQGDNTTQTNFYTINSPGGLTSRNVRSLYIDKHYAVGSKPLVWVAQGTFISSSTTLAGGFSVGPNDAPNWFTKGYIGLQVSPYVTTSNARTPSCTSVGGNKDEVWVFAIGNFNTNQIVRYRADSGPNAYLGAYDASNTPVLTSGFRANAIFFDNLERGWIGLQDGGLIIKSGNVWKKMNASSLFPAGTNVNANAITQDQLGNIYIGTTNGLLIYRGGAVDSASSYRRVSTTDGLVSNIITGVAVDTFKNRIILAHNAGITFMSYRKKFNATLEWDYSFPKPNIKPLGVAADGIARLLIKVKIADTIVRRIHEVQMSIINNIGNRTNFIGGLLGKLKIANLFNLYSNEANTGTSQEVSRTDSTPAGEFWFWYVAPEDFSADSTGPESQKTERRDSVKVKVRYNDNTEDSSILSIAVHRPPVLGGSMLGGIGKILSGLLISDSIPLLQSGLLTQKMGLMLDPLKKLSEMVKNLIDVDVTDPAFKNHSIPGLIEAMRDKGIASNRVDFVGHGLFGNIGRMLPQLFGEKFFADGGFKFNNYSKGFFNKFITIGTPHNGSLFAELFKVLPGMNNFSKGIISKALKAFPTDLFPYKVFNTGDSALQQLSEIMKAVQLDSAAFRLMATPVKNHLIVSNVDMDEDNPPVLHVRKGGLFGNIGGIASLLLRDISPSVEKLAMNSLFDSSTGSLSRLLNSLNTFGMGKLIQNFSRNSDLFSHTTSQSAGQALTLPHITNVLNSNPFAKLHESTLNLGNIGQKILNLLNSSVQSNLFSDLIPANTAPIPPPLEVKPNEAFYDTMKIVTDDRQITGLRISNDTSIVLKFRVKDTVGLQLVFVNFQDTMYTSISKQRNQQITLKVKRLMAYSGLQQIAAVGVYETADSIKYHADTTNTYVTPPDSLQGFRVTENEVDLFEGNPYYPTYEVNIAGEWQPLASNDTAIKITIQHPSILVYDNSRVAFDAIAKGLTRAYFSYKQFKDTVLTDCQAPLSLFAINRSIASGSFKSPSTWSKGRAPIPEDSIIISATHSIQLDTTLQIRSLRIDNGGTLSLSQNMQLKLGSSTDGDFMVDNFGTLNISNGTLTVNGRVKLNNGSTFNMSGGTLVIDGNTGNTFTSLQDGAYLFEASIAMSSFSFTGGTLQIIDPPISVSSQALNCPHNFGINSTLILGNGTSQTASSNPNGFGGALFPPLLGTLILDAGTSGNNRQLTITKPLNVQGTFTVKSGSNLILKAAVNVSQ